MSGYVYVTAADPDGLKGQDVFRLKINQPPVLTVPGPQTADFHDALTFGISATDPDGDPITLGASGLPAGLAFVDNGNGTGTVSGTLQAIPAVYVATFSASDGHNPPVTATVEITVTKEETTLTYTGPTVILNGGNVTLSALLTEDDPTPVASRTVEFHARRAIVQWHHQRERHRQLRDPRQLSARLVNPDHGRVRRRRLLPPVVGQCDSARVRVPEPRRVRARRRQRRWKRGGRLLGQPVGRDEQQSPEGRHRRRSRGSRER